jgi:peptide chain release factor 3
VEGWPALESLGRLFNTTVVQDQAGRPVLLFRNEWNLQQVMEDHPKLNLSPISPLLAEVVG